MLADHPVWGWERPVPPPPTVEQMHDDLIDALEEALAHEPIQQQTVQVVVVWDEDSWRVDIRDAPPTGLMKANEGRADCLIDFDQYHGTVDDIRRMTAESLAEDLMDQVEPDWRRVREFGPAWDADPPDYH